MVCADSVTFYQGGGTCGTVEDVEANYYRRIGSLLLSQVGHNFAKGNQIFPTFVGYWVFLNFIFPSFCDHLFCAVSLIKYFTIVHQAARAEGGENNKLVDQPKIVFCSKEKFVKPKDVI